MDKSKIIAGLEDLIEDRESFIEPDEPNSQFVYDKAILQAAVDLIRRAAPENKEDSHEID
ncbi:MAG TPA: hypothetical protein DC001_02320 [Clostridiales bacterium]|jgi:hypothetical protein|nr:hypothetical protein [Clostridiales bacterium]